MRALGSIRMRSWLRWERVAWARFTAPRDGKLKRDVAIKVLPDFWARDPDRLHRFELEVQAAVALNHPNIVSIFHVGQYNGSP